MHIIIKKNEPHKFAKNTKNNNKVFQEICSAKKASCCICTKSN